MKSSSSRLASSEMLPVSTPAAAAVDRPPSSWWAGVWGRRIISLAIAVHLLALLGEPLRIFSRGTQPASPDADLVRGGLSWYIDFMYLHHGYFFFAPNPGPSHLMDIRLTHADGTERHLRLPNHRAQWPRLLYHRHFMLSEFLYQLYTPPPALENTNEELPLRQAWQRDRERFERVRSSMERHLADRYGAKRADIQLMEHRLPNAVEVFEQQMALDDERLYVILPDQPPSEVRVSPMDATGRGPISSGAAATRTDVAKQRAANVDSRADAASLPPASAQPEEVKP